MNRYKKEIGNSSRVLVPEIVSRVCCAVLIYMLCYQILQI